MTVAQIDQALRDFALQDTAAMRKLHLRVLRGEGPKVRHRMVSELVWPW
jgi:hypothetical protein